MTTVSVFDFRNNLAEYLRMVENGEELAITRFNKPIANILLPKTKAKAKDFSEYLGFLGKNGETGREYVNRIRSKSGFN